MNTYNYIRVYIHLTFKCVTRLFRVYQLYEQFYFFMYTYFFFVYNRSHLVNNCLCCFLIIHLYSNKLSSITTTSSLSKLESIPAFFLVVITSIHHKVHQNQISKILRLKYLKQKSLKLVI